MIECWTACWGMGAVKMFDFFCCCFNKGGSGILWLNMGWKSRHESETVFFFFFLKGKFHPQVFGCLPPYTRTQTHIHSCMWSSEPNYSSFRFPHQSRRLQGASLSRLSTLLFKWPITLNGVDTNFPLQISYDFHDRFL